MVRKVTDSFVRHLRFNRLLSNFFLVLVYSLLGYLGFFFTYTNQNSVSIVWPAIGFAVFYLHFFGLRNWPGVLLGALIVNFTSAKLFYFSVTAAFGTLVTVYLIVRFALPDPRNVSGHIFSSFRNMSRFLILGFLLAPLLSAIVGISGLAMNGIILNSDRFIFNVAKWWMGDSLGILFLVPFLICHFGRSENQELVYSDSKFEKYLLLLGLATMDFFIFCRENNQGHPVIPIYFQFPVLILITARLGPKALTEAILLESTIAISGMVIGQGPFYRSLLIIDFQQIWLVMSVTSGTNLLLAAALHTEKQSRKALQLQEEMFSTVANQSPVMLWLAKGLKRFHFFNDRCCDFTGRTLQELQGDVWLDLIHPDEKQKTQESFQRAFRERTPFLVKYRLRRGNGGYSWVLNQGIPVVNSGQKTSYFIGSCTDVDEIESNKNKAVAESEQKTNFLGMVSHELRTPMNSVLGYVELLKRTPLTPKQKEYIHSIEVSGRVLKNLLKDFLDISRIQSGKLSFEFLPFSIEKMLEEVGAINKESYLLKNITLLTNIDPEFKRRLVIGDLNRIRQVILNLLSNAVKFSYQDSVLLVRVSLGEKKENHHCVQFEIIDQGIGIDLDAQKKIFEKYWQVNQDTTQITDAGVGLGLSICKDLVEAMGGDIGVQSYPGFGTKVWFRLPMKFSECNEGEATAKILKTQDKAFIPAFKSKMRKALVIEDNFANSKLLKEMLFQFGWDAFCVYSGKEALQNFSFDRFNVVFLDMNLPDMKGDEVAQQLKKQKNNLDFKIVGITGEDTSARGARTKFQYFDELLQKPLSMEDLKRTLQISES